MSTEVDKNQTIEESAEITHPESLSVWGLAWPSILNNLLFASVGLVAIKAAQEAKGQSGESIAEIVAKSAMPEDSDPRLILKTNSSLVCKIKFSSLGALPAGFYQVGEDEDSYYYEEVDTD